MQVSSVCVLVNFIYKCMWHGGVRWRAGNEFRIHIFKVPMLVLPGADTAVDMTWSRKIKSDLPQKVFITQKEKKRRQTD